MENSPPHDSAQDSARRFYPIKRNSSDLDGPDRNLWKENHGNWLLAFTALLCLIGVTIIACQQARFTPPSFPSRLTRSQGSADQSPASVDATGEPTAAVRVVELSILGAASDEGLMRIAMYVTPQDFNDPASAFEVDSWQIVDGVCTGKWEISPEHKRFAIAAYHDANENGELDRNALGIPSERYGYTAGARGLTGPPTFEEAAIAVPEKQIEISIR